MSAAEQHGMTDEEWNDLTDEERAGLEEDTDDTEGEEPEDQDGASDEGEDADDDSNEEGKEGESDDADPDTSGDEDDGAGESEEDGDDDSGDPKEGAQDSADDNADDPQEPRQRQQVPLLRSELPEDYQTRLDSVAERKKGLLGQFVDGDITVEEYEQQRESLEDERQELLQVKRENELAQKIVAGQREQAWVTAVSDFVEDHPVIKTNEMTWRGMDQHVMAVNSEEEHAGKSNHRRLEIAYGRFVADLKTMGIEIDGNDLRPVGQAKEAPDTKGKEKSAAKPRKKVKAPPTLSGVPQSEIEGTKGGKFAELNRLYESNRPEDQAKADDLLASLSEAEQSRYLAS